MKDKLEEAAAKYREILLDNTDLNVNYEEDNYDSGIRDAIIEHVGCAFEAGAQWQKENMWIPVEEMTESDYDNSLLVMVEDGTVYLNDDTWEEHMQKPTHYLIIPKFKKVKNK